MLDFYDFLNEQSGRWNRYMESAVYDAHDASGLDHWCQISFPRLQDLIRDELSREAA